MAHLVGDVVDGEEVTDRGRETSAATRLVRAADDAELGDATAGLTHAEMSEVVVARSDDLADDVALTAGLAAVRQDLGLGEATGCAAGPVRRDCLS